ncbi:hypothetical protein PFISCL1PPCAC_14628, partial [Pristionchus fissidentatus]
GGIYGEIGVSTPTRLFPLFLLMSTRGRWEEPARLTRFTRTAMRGESSWVHALLLHSSSSVLARDFSSSFHGDPRGVRPMIVCVVHQNGKMHFSFHVCDLLRDALLLSSHSPSPSPSLS